VRDTANTTARKAAANRVHATVNGLCLWQEVSASNNYNVVSHTTGHGHVVTTRVQEHFRRTPCIDVESGECSETFRHASEG
jgi:hypothetical protein